MHSDQGRTNGYPCTRAGRPLISSAAGEAGSPEELIDLRHSAEHELGRWQAASRTTYRGLDKEVVVSNLPRLRRKAPDLPPLLIDLAAGSSPSPTEIDDRLVKLANEHGLTGLLWSWARDNLADLERKEELAQNDLYIQAHLVNVWKVLDESVAQLTAAGIEVATVKGVTAGERWYDRRGDRPCSDVDLLLAPNQLERATDAVRILDLGHPWGEHVSELATTGRIQTVTTHVDGLEVDLHFDLFKIGIPTRASRDIWDRTTPFPLPHGGTVRVLDDTTALLHFLVHINKDRFQRLLGYADVARIIATGRVDWTLARRVAEREGLTVPAFRTLDVVLDRLELPWPVELDRPTGMRVGLWNLIWRPGIRLRGAEGRLRFRRRGDWIAFLARGRMLEALRWWLREMWPPSSAVNARYAHVRGPYLWKLLKGRVMKAQNTRATLAERHATSPPEKS